MYSDPPGYKLRVSDTDTNINSDTNSGKIMMISYFGMYFM